MPKENRVTFATSLGPSMRVASGVPSTGTSCYAIKQHRFRPRCVQCVLSRTKLSKWQIKADRSRWGNLSHMIQHVDEGVAYSMYVFTHASSIPIEFPTSCSSLLETAACGDDDDLASIAPAACMAQLLLFKDSVN